MPLNKSATEKASPVTPAPKVRCRAPKRTPPAVARRNPDRAVDREAKFKKSEAPPAEFLRRQRVTSRTQDTHKAVVDRFYQQEGLKRTDDVAVLDAAMNRRILRKYFDGEAIGTARYLVHAMKWDKGVETKAFPGPLLRSRGTKTCRTSKRRTRTRGRPYCSPPRPGASGELATAP